MDSDKIEAVLVLREIGSMRQAAERLHCSQSALSQMLKYVERELGVQLFDRSPTGLSARSEADTVFQEMQHLVQQAARLNQVAQDQQRGCTGRIELRCVDSAHQHITPRLLTLWLQQHPHIPIGLSTSSPAQQINDLVNQQCDACFIRLPYDHDHIVTHRILNEPLVLAWPKRWLNDSSDSIPSFCADCRNGKQRQSCKKRQICRRQQTLSKRSTISHDSLSGYARSGHRRCNEPTGATLPA